MSDKKSIESRRKLLKSIAAGSGAIVAGTSLPDSWSRPVVDSVMLPAHAQTSNNGPFAGTATTQNSALDLLISQAHAVEENFPPYVCVEPNAALDKATVKLLTDREGVPKLYTFVDVPVLDRQCNYTVSLPCDKAGAGELLRDFGLIKDAHAEPEQICCYLDSVTGVGAGRLEIETHPTVEFNVGPNSCNMPNVCPPD